jgi:uncharacterized membrane protein
MKWLDWSLAIAAATHIGEEFVWPGGFKEWWIAYRPATAAHVTNRFLVFINTLLLGMAILIAFAVRFPRGNGVAAWLTLAALLFSNAIFHILGAIETRRYSPGMITGICLYMPLTVMGYIHFVQTGRATIPTAICAALLGGSYHFISFARHRRRGRLASRREIET